MGSNIVSVRIPSSLVEELEKVSRKDHYLDLSEAVRSIIRERWQQEKDPLSFQVKKLRDDISKNLESKNQQMLLKELERIMEGLK